MSDDNLQLLTIALQLIETVSRQEGVDIAIYSDINIIQAYDHDTDKELVTVERKDTNE